MKLINLGFECSNPHLFEESTLCFVFHVQQITVSVCGKVGLNQFISTNGSLLFYYTTMR